jgi:hypothetical protein
MFAGDEIGASYSPYSNLTPIPWRDRYRLLPLYRTLISLKRHLPTLRSRHLDLLPVSADSAFAFLRPAFGGGPPVVVLLNFASPQPHMEVTLKGSAAAAVGSGTMRDLLTGKSVHLRVSGSVATIHMPAHSAFVLTPRGR